jgi:transcriptional regulator with XRE-family HTH domain
MKKAPSFRKILSDAIKRDFKTRRAFAQAAGVSEGRISQVLSGLEDPRPETLRWIVQAFPDVATQDILTTAYVADYLNADPTPLSVHSALELCEGLFNSGRVNRAVVMARRGLRLARNPREWMTVAERLFPLYLRLSQVSKALELRNLMAEKAMEDSDRVSVLTSLTLKANAIHSLDSAKPEDVQVIHTQSLELLHAIKETEDAGLKNWAEVKASSLWREYSLLILYMHERGNSQT